MYKARFSFNLYFTNHLSICVSFSCIYILVHNWISFVQNWILLLQKIELICEKFNFIYAKLNFTFAKSNFLREKFNLICANYAWKWHRWTIAAPLAIKKRSLLERSKFCNAHLQWFHSFNTRVLKFYIHEAIW